MGCIWSKRLINCIWTKRRHQYEDPAVLAAETCFSVREVEALYELFRKLSCSLTDDGLISKEEFQLGLFGDRKKQNLFADRIFYLFDDNRDGVIDYREFIRSLSIFHPNSPEADKITFAYRMYDLRQTGFIEREEVKEMLLALLNESEIILSDDIVEDILDKTFAEADSKADGKLDQEEWREFVLRNPSIMRNMTIPHLKDITTSFPSFAMREEAGDDADIDESLINAKNGTN
ncbi:hypothetical protein MRB53_030304 [Persea americana]|uniref:Uncharacterized protein n=1 Tax=Persea americana TaxID=3435 RepID=A0ACC2KL91_PERAE|nr:hypothetical protein MRB53_030304 [Persea americana]